MNGWRKISWFSAALVLVALVAAGEGWCIFERAAAAKKAQAKLAQKRREFASLTATEPAPTAENETAIAADLARLTQALDAMRASLKGRGSAADALRTAAAPERRPDAFFDIATFVEKMREGAQRHDVALKPEERFGFAEYANAGPEPELIAEVFHERLIAQYLLETLFEAQPQRLLSVQRERPLTKAERLAASGAGGGRRDASTVADYFEIDPRVSARVPGFVEATAFRLSFVGQTGVLRTLLNKFAAFELPVVVRSVEVEPAAGNERGGSGAAAIPGAPVEPLIRRTFSRFTVTVEYIELEEPKS